MKVIMYPAISLDGFIADAKGSSDWVTDQDGELFEAQARSAGCVVVGRKSYEQYKDDIFPISGTFTIVVTSKTESYDSNDKVVFMNGDVKSILELAKQNGFNEILLAGGGELNGLFASQNAIDEAIISIYPLVLVSGTRIFGSFSGKLDLKLTETKTLNEGIVQNRYEVVK